MTVDGVDLGRAMLPNDVYIILKRVADLDDDEMLEAFQAGIAHLAALPADAAPGERIGMTAAEAEAAIKAASEVTRSRLRAWRARARQMTWGELRVLIRGL